MNDLELLAFGCVVTFIGAAGAYVYVRESFLARAGPQRASRTRDADAVECEVSEIA